jgi:hypothetical protein
VLIQFPGAIINFKQRMQMELEEKELTMDAIPQQPSSEE